MSYCTRNLTRWGDDRRALIKTDLHVSCLGFFSMFCFCMFMYCMYDWCMIRGSVVISWCNKKNNNSTYERLKTARWTADRCACNVATARWLTGVTCWKLLSDSWRAESCGQRAGLKTERAGCTSADRRERQLHRCTIVLRLRRFETENW